MPIDKLFEVETEKHGNHTFYSCRRCRVRLRARFRAALVNHLAACTSAPPKVLGPYGIIAGPLNISMEFMRVDKGK